MLVTIVGVTVYGDSGSFLMFPESDNGDPLRSRVAVFKEVLYICLPGFNRTEICIAIYRRVEVRLLRIIIYISFRLMLECQTRY